MTPDQLAWIADYERFEPKDDLPPLPKETDMAYEMKELSGSLFKNDKEGVETRPDYKGSALVNGSEFWLSAWIKDGAKGKYMSLSFKRKDGPAKAQGSGQAPAQPARANEENKGFPVGTGTADFEDDIPF